jgi:hypothetical protein
MSTRHPMAAKPATADRRIAAPPALSNAAIDTAPFTTGVPPKRRALFEKRFPRACGDTP